MQKDEVKKLSRDNGFRLFQVISRRGDEVVEIVVDRLTEAKMVNGGLKVRISVDLQDVGERPSRIISLQSRSTSDNLATDSTGRTGDRQLARTSWQVPGVRVGT